MEDKEKQTTITLGLGNYEKQLFIDYLTKPIETYRRTLSSNTCDLNDNDVTDDTIKEMENMVALLKSNGDLKFNANEVYFNPFDIIIKNLATNLQYFTEQRKTETEEQAKIILYLGEHENSLLIDHITKRIKVYRQIFNSKACGLDRKVKINKIIKWFEDVIAQCKNNGNIELNANEVNFNPFVITFEQLTTYALHFAGQRVKKAKAE